MSEIIKLKSLIDGRVVERQIELRDYVQPPPICSKHPYGPVIRYRNGLRVRICSICLKGGDVNA